VNYEKDNRKEDCRQEEAEGRQEEVSWKPRVSVS
jgi:hypothetical protein